MAENVLYHYTSIDTLEKILLTRTIRFGNLSSVDDVDVDENEDLGRFGRFCYVSCWTNEEKESIPMWNMYAHDMAGVRIEMKEFPFEQYFYEDKDGKPFKTYIDTEERDKQGEKYILHVYPELVEIDYTEREELLYPRIKNVIEKIEEENGQRKKSTSYTYTVNHLGCFKRKCWSFQKEWRYKIFVSPYTYSELKNCKNPEEAVALIARLEDDNIRLSESIFLKLDGECIKHMRILVGPKATEEQIEKVKQLANQAGVESPVEKSSLRIR